MLPHPFRHTHFLVSIFLSIQLAIGAILFLPTKVRAQDPIGALVVGVFLNKLMDRVEDAIRAAENAGRGVAIEAGIVAQATIENARIAYADMLDRTIDKLNDAANQQMQQLNTMVIELERNIKGDLSIVFTSAQQIANSLPLSKTMPQIRAWGPHFVAPSTTAFPVQVSFDGNFVDAMKPKFAPQLQIGDKTYEIVENTTQQLKFLVPSNELITDQGDGFTYKKAKLIVPYKIGLLGKKRVAEFNFLLGKLPASPGKITLYSRRKSTKTEIQHIKTNPPFSQDSSNDDLKDVLVCGPQHPGWSVNAGTIKWVNETITFSLLPGRPPITVPWVQGEEGSDWWKSFRTAGPPVCYTVTTIHHGLGTSGKVHWHYEYDIQRTSESTSDFGDPETVVLNWNDSKTFPYAAGFWKIIFDGFDGSHKEFVGVEDNPFLRLSVNGSNITISARPPQEISWP